ncbi:MAG: sigma factor-like helix-turn-helix DNA-binding protein [Janthinobacterium lividum]
MKSSRTPVQPLLRQALSSSAMLSADAERDLLLQFHTNASKTAMDELVRSHMPIIFRAASRSAKNPGIDINDLIMTATEGLLIAINRWSFEKSEASGSRLTAELAMERQENGQENGQDGSEESAEAAPDVVPARNSRLATYAMWWMRILLTDSVIENRGMVVRAKNPKTRKALFALPAAIKALDIRLPLTGGDVTRLADHLGIGTREIEEALIHASGDVMLDEPIGDGSARRGDNMGDQMAESEDSIITRLASTDRWNAICETMMALPARDRFILITRYLLTQKWKLERLSETLKMSRERIRQIGDDCLTLIRSQVPSEDVPHRLGSETAAAKLDALIRAVEAVSTAQDPAETAAFLAASGIATGPTRIARRPAMRMLPGPCVTTRPASQATAKLTA